MIKSRGIHHLILSLVFLTCYLWGIGQPTLDPDMKKPKKYENRILRSEKTGDKKFNLPRRFFQNTFTHYNYAFNATAKLNQVIQTNAALLLSGGYSPRDRGEDVASTAATTTASAREFFRLSPR